MGYSQAAADRQVLRVICAYPAIEPVTYKHAVQTLLCLPSMVPVRQTRWCELNYNSSRRHIDCFDEDSSSEDQPEDYFESDPEIQQSSELSENMPQDLESDLGSNL